MLKLYFKPARKSDVVSKLNSFLVDLPSPVNIHWSWNFGSLMGICLGIQIITGIFLSLHYHNGAYEAFDSICHIHRDVNFGWFLRLIHMNGASGFFVFLYLHVWRGMYYGSYNNIKVWLIGVIIIFLLMATAFVGYVLPYGQMSFWGATVITNLVSAIPYIGVDLVYWLWGGFAVGNATVLRFFVFHFLLPFVVGVFALMHLLVLHESGSNNPLGIMSNGLKIRFHPYFSFKDTISVMFYFLLLMMLIFKNPFYFGDCENFFLANPMTTPTHIKPEWYFLWAYAILRCVPNKVGGVVLLIFGILILMFMSFYKNYYQSIIYYPMMSFMFWLFVGNLFILTWIGSRPAEEPYYTYSQFSTFFYFSYFIYMPLYMSLWDFQFMDKEIN